MNKKVSLLEWYISDWLEVQMGEYLALSSLDATFNLSNRQRFSNVIWDLLMNRCTGL